LKNSENNCPFCAIAPDQIILERPLALVKRDGYPLTKGHSLIIPRRHVASFFDCTAEERQAMLELLDEAKAILDKEHAPDGYNIGLNNGPAAGQTVMHVHMHLIPRYAGDTSDPRGGVRWIFPDKAKYWKSRDEG
jgi:diadenosine tetraphosphate (Ap4A) HIT family hydrolase